MKSVNFERKIVLTISCLILIFVSGIAGTAACAIALMAHKKLSGKIAFSFHWLPLLQDLIIDGNTTCSDEICLLTDQEQTRIIHYIQKWRILTDFNKACNQKVERKKVYRKGVQGKRKHKNFRMSRFHHSFTIVAIHALQSHYQKFGPNHCV